MSINQLIEQPTCRYCLETDMTDMIRPCKCKGSMAYVHRDCLRQWYRKKNSAMVLPLYFSQFDSFHCELCHDKYDCDYAVVNNSRHWVWEITKYILGLTTVLFMTYFLVGLIMWQFNNTKHVFLYDQNTWVNVLGNGFCMTHIIIGGIYILIGLIFILSSSSVVCCFCPNMNTDGHNGTSLTVLLVILIIFSIICSVVIIYIDIVSRVMQRYDNNTIEILDIRDKHSSQNIL